MVFGDVYTSEDMIFVYLGSRYEILKKLMQANDLRDNLDILASSYNLMDYGSRFLIRPKRKGKSIEWSIDSLLSNPNALRTCICHTDAVERLLPMQKDGINDKYYSVLYNMEKRLKYWGNKAEDIKTSYTKYKMLNIGYVPEIETESNTKEQKKFLNAYFKSKIPEQYLGLKCGDVIYYDDSYALYTGMTRDYFLDLRKISYDEENHCVVYILNSAHFVGIWNDYNFKKVNYIDYNGLELSYVLPVGGLR